VTLILRSEYCERLRFDPGGFVGVWWGREFGLGWFVTVGRVGRDGGEFQRLTPRVVDRFPIGRGIQGFVRSSALTFRMARHSGRMRRTDPFPKPPFILIKSIRTP
jgi:hypothetical protein